MLATTQERLSALEDGPTQGGQGEHARSARPSWAGAAARSPRPSVEPGGGGSRRTIGVVQFINKVYDRAYEVSERRLVASQVACVAGGGSEVGGG